SGKVWALMDWGFAPENIIYLTYGDSADVHPELVDGISTKANVQAAFDTIAARATYNDMVHVWWVDHGNTSGFQAHDALVYFTELKVWIDSIDCKAYIGAYNPCFSGAIMSHMQGLCNEQRRVITATSVNASQGNSYGWAGQWRFAMRGGRPDTYAPWYADKNQDGYIALDEAYEWETPHSNNDGEYPLFDDNGDGIGGDLTNPSTYDSSGQDSTKDGFYGQFYTLMAWYDREVVDNEMLFSSGSWFNPQPTDIEIEWSTGAPLPTPVCRGASGVIGDKIYVFGGHPSPEPIHYVYDITNDIWSTVETMPIHGSLTRGVVYDGKLYVFGGHTLGSDTMRCYDPVTNSWKLLSAPYSGWRECCKYGAAVVGDKIYYYYMENSYSYYPQQTFWEYDVVNDTFVEQLTPPAPKRMYIASSSDGNYCYAVGGLSHVDLTPIQDAVRYDPLSSNWEAIDSLPEPIAFTDGDFLKGKFFIAGGGAGYNPWPASDHVYCWSEGIGWMSATSLPAPVGVPHVELATINTIDYIFVFGGYNNGYLNTLYIGKINNLGTEEIPRPRPKPILDLDVNPNLIRDQMTVNFSISSTSEVTLLVYDVTGKIVRYLTQDNYQAGFHQLSFNLKDLPSGIYFLKLKTPEDQERIKIIKIR
ncbi:T9SS type A sorting domain-containing protein, partial [candidate division WOR-3 bacterium]|nr:T9SS type A sorting domain-containing protein [candidate division WOR-3 bacterium]